MTALLTLTHVQKSFGTHHVLQDLSFSIPTGSIFGFVGENGAGKTTTMRLLLGLEKSKHGSILLAGQEVTFGGNRTNSITGYLPDVPAFYDYMTATEYLTLCARLTRVANREQRIAEMLNLVGLKTKKQRIHGFSRGMKQRLGIAQALLNEPQLLICDEPTSALDPLGRNEFLELLATLRGKVTVLFSTHILSDVERICDYVGILHAGRMQKRAPLSDLRNQYGRSRIMLTFPDTPTAKRCMQVLAHFPAYAVKNTVMIDYQGSYTNAAHQVLQTLTASVTPIALQHKRPTLEQIFLEVTGNAHSDNHV
ncbi:ATP-binding cassette domain-containing protein [Liquorilactobacillus satsumensis]|uniref:ABC transporter ATP-binding protein n=1 Tax=Liquorilactobacillus satsumensis TaxID=259059 RepID=UPI0039EBD582